jgi:ferrous iron transport protein B
MDTLQQLQPGQSGMIVSVGGHVPAVKRRLVDMGLTPGTIVTVRKIAPLGDPIEVNLRSYELSVRKEDAGCIEIEPVSESKRARKKRTVYGGAPKRELDPEMIRRMELAHEHELEAHPHEEDHTAHDSRTMKVALVGNPNCGKTTLFNALTGSNQYVGNWPGVTVEKKEGTAKLDDREVTVVDLPGIYSLSPYSMEEIVARSFIIDEKPDAIIDIIDATNIERNMYLTCQLLELERPTVIALNFMDEARKNGDEIDVEKLSHELGIPVVPIVARTGENINTLLRTAHIQMHRGFTIEPDDLYDDYTHAIHHRIGELTHNRAYEIGLPAHWVSIKLLEGDEIVERKLDLDEQTRAKVDAIVREYEDSDELGDRETLVADSRYSYIESVVSASVKKGRPADEATTTEKIDRIVTGKYTAIPLFLLMMFIMFAVTFGPIGSYLSDLVDVAINGYFADFMRTLLSTKLGVQPWCVSLVVDGIIGGVGGVLTFLPQIALLFLFLSFLEDSGYMSRAAFIMDRLLRRFGLSGKAFIPMLMGFGCSVPAVMGARTMENEKDRRMTIMLVPFMSCSAKLPVYGLITSAFFGAKAGIVVFALYVIGLCMGILSGILFKHTLFRGDPAPFVLELPPYRMPTLKNISLHVWERVRGFLVKAGTLILLMSVLLWLLQTFNFHFQMVDDSAESMLGVIGSVIAPIFRPLGFGTWQAAVSLLTGLVAKEAVVASMSLFYGFSTLDGASAIASSLTGFRPLTALSFLVFVLLYVPCVAAVSTIRKEMNSTKWTLASIGWQIICAYIVSLIVYQLGCLLGF